MRPDRTALCSLALVPVSLPVAGACLLPLALLSRRALGGPPRPSAPGWNGSGGTFIAQAGVRGRRFRIRVVDLPEANARSVGRDLVCVTTGALDQLGDRELAGVLAHELGHHLRMHTSASAFLVWVLLPLQGVALLGSLLAASIAAFANVLTARRCPVGERGERGGHRWISGCARHAAVRIARPTHPPLDRRMARIAVRVEQ